MRNKMPDSEPGSGHTDPQHDWQHTRTVLVPTGFPRFMQFHVSILECGRCSAQMTTMSKTEGEEDIYQTPRCQETQKQE